MLKEIYEQPEAVAETIGDRVRHGRLCLEGLGMADEELADLRRIVILASGTAYHAGVAARYAIEEWGRVPVEHDIASEWVYRNPVLDTDTLVIGISQSGETRDTIEAMKLARSMGAHTVAITNMMGSQITREVDSVLYTRAGLEVERRRLEDVHRAALAALPGRAQAREGARDAAAGGDRVHRQRGLQAAGPDRAVPRRQPSDRGDRRRYFDRPFFLYLGRNIGLPVALEGALKLKEISYIPTEAYSAGEMKHGPIALLDEDTPVVVVATKMEHVYDKIVSNIQEVRARGAHVIAIASDGNEDIQHHADDVIYVPEGACVPAGRAGRGAAAAARLPDRAPARPERRPAAEPGQDRHRRIEAARCRGFDWVAFWCDPGFSGRKGGSDPGQTLDEYSSLRDRPTRGRAAARRARTRRTGRGRGAAGDPRRRAAGRGDDAHAGARRGAGARVLHRGRAEGPPVWRCPTIWRRTRSRWRRRDGSRSGWRSVLHVVVVRGLRQGRARGGGGRDAARRGELRVGARRWSARCRGGCARRKRGSSRPAGCTRRGCSPRAGDLLCVREDVGRHNAMDKVIGWAFA